MAQYKLPKWSINLIKSYLENRNFMVKLEDTTSSPRTATAGVPRRFVLGPLLYNLFTADIPQPPQCKLAQFTDDTAHYSYGRVPSATTRKPTTDLKILTNWFIKWKIKVNENKTTSVYFSNKDRTPQNQVKMNETRIPWSKQVTYLGVIIDHKLTFAKLLKSTAQKAKQLIGRLYLLIHRKSKMSLENKIRIIKTIFIPSLLYGCEAGS